MVICWMQIIFQLKKNETFIRCSTYFIRRTGNRWRIFDTYEEEKEELISKEPQAISFIRHYMMGKDFIDRKPRYCIWLVGADPSLLKRCPLVRERIDKVREFRMASTRNNTRKAADTPGLFASILEYDSPYIAIPKVSSQNRRYIPMDYLDGEIIPE